jgi:DNA/RNA-binding domain of Phe-tRNA-synthetase-like protein
VEKGEVVRREKGGIVVVECWPWRDLLPRRLKQSCPKVWAAIHGWGG